MQGEHVTPAKAAVIRRRGKLLGAPPAPIHDDPLDPADPTTAAAAQAIGEDPLAEVVEDQLGALLDEVAGMSDEEIRAVLAEDG